MTLNDIICFWKKDNILICAVELFEWCYIMLSPVGLNQFLHPISHKMIYLVAYPKLSPKSS